MRQKPLPPFLEQRIKEHYQDRFVNEWGGESLFKSPSPSSDDVPLNNNDYLCICKNKLLPYSRRENTSAEVLMSSFF